MICETHVDLRILRPKFILTSFSRSLNRCFASYGNVWIKSRVLPSFITISWKKTPPCSPSSKKVRQVIKRFTTQASAWASRSSWSLWTLHHPNSERPRFVQELIQWLVESNSLSQIEWFMFSFRLIHDNSLCENKWNLPQFQQPTRIGIWSLGLCCTPWN